MVHFYSVDGLLPVDYQLFFGPGYLENVKSVAPPSVQYTHIGEDNGCAVIWQRIVPGIPFVSARSLININYPFQIGDEYFFVSSSRANEHLVAQNKAKICDDVIANLKVNYISMKPKLDSTGEKIGTDLI